MAKTRTFHRVKSGAVQIVSVLNPLTFVVKCSDCKNVKVIGSDSKNLLPEFAEPWPFSPERYPHVDQQVYVWHEDLFLRGIVRSVNIIVNLCVVQLIDDYQLMKCSPARIYPLRPSSTFSPDMGHCHLVGVHDALLCSPFLPMPGNEEIIKESWSAWKLQRTRIKAIVDLVKLVNFEAISVVDNFVYGRVSLVLRKGNLVDVVDFLRDHEVVCENEDFEAGITKIKSFDLSGGSRRFLDECRQIMPPFKSTPPVITDAVESMRSEVYELIDTEDEFYLTADPPLTANIARSRLMLVKMRNNLVALKQVVKVVKSKQNPLMTPTGDFIIRERMASLSEASANAPKRPGASLSVNSMSQVKSDKVEFNFSVSLNSLKERGGAFIGKFDFEGFFAKEKQSFEHLLSSFNDLKITWVNDFQILSFPGLLTKRDFVLVAEPDRMKSTILLALFTVLCLKDSLILRVCSSGKFHSRVVQAQDPSNMRHSPKCVFFVPGWQRGQALQEKLQCFSPTFRVCEVYGYLLPEGLRDKLLKCDILVTTPSCWLRIYESELISKDYVLHMIFDTCEELARRFPDELLEIFDDEFVEFNSADGIRRTIRIQKIISCCEFNYRVHEFKDLLHEPLVCVDDSLNLLTLAGIRPALIYPTKPFEIDFPEGINSKKKVAIFCDDAEQADSLVVSPSRTTFVVHERLSSEQLKERMTAWSKTDLGYLICSDKAHRFGIYCDSVVHFTWPASKELLIRRMNLLKNAIEDSLKNSLTYHLERPDGDHYVIVRPPETHDKLNFIARFEYPETLNFKSLLGHESPSKPICSDVLEYAFCNDLSNCGNRHFFQADDQTSALTKIRYIKFKPTEIMSVNHFKVQLISSNADYRCRNEFWTEGPHQQIGPNLEVIVADLMPEDVDTSWNPAYAKGIKYCFDELEKSSLQCFGKVQLALKPGLVVLKDVNFYVTTSSNACVLVGSYADSICSHRFCDVDSLFSSQLMAKSNEAELKHYFINDSIGTHIELEVGELVRCRVTVSESPSSFYVLLNENVERLRDFKESLGNWIGDKGTTRKSIIAPGQMCIVAPSAGLWERGAVVSVLNDSTVRIFLLDCGQEKDFHVDDIFEIPEAFLNEFAFQALHCELDGLIPLDVDAGWCEASKSKFNDIIFEKDGAPVELTLKTSCETSVDELTGVTKVKVLGWKGRKSIAQVLFRDCLANVINRDCLIDLNTMN